KRRMKVMRWLPEKKYLTVRKGKAAGSSKKDSEKEIKAKGDHNLSEGKNLADSKQNSTTTKKGVIKQPTSSSSNNSVT
ncbi:unnamed protein product, partial [Rotaria sp. Silwood1]